MADKPNNQETSKKKRGRPKGSKNKNSSSAPSLSSEDPSLTQPSAFEIIMDYLDSTSNTLDIERQKELQDKLERTYYKDITEVNKSLTYCENILGETLEDFVVIGHTYSGERIKIFKANTPKDLDCLREASKQFIIPFLTGTSSEE